MKKEIDLFLLIGIVIITGIVFTVWKFWPQLTSLQVPILTPQTNQNLSNYEDSPFAIAAEFYAIENGRKLDSRFITPPGATKDYLIDLGVKWVGETYFSWQVVEPLNGSFKFDNYYDPMAVGLADSGIKTMNVIDTQNDPDQQTCHPNNPCSSPCNETAYKDFVKKLVERYDGDEDYGCTLSAPDCYKQGDGQYPSAETRQAIKDSPWKYWSVGNEPDMGCVDKGVGISCFWTPCETGGQMDEYFHVMEITSSSIKESCPDCKVLNGALAGLLGSLVTKGNEPIPESTLLSTWLARIDEHELNYFDVMNYHDYDSIANINTRLKLFNTRYGNTKELVITEMGAFSTEQGYDIPMHNYDYSEITQAQEIIKRYVLPLKEGVDIIAYFTLVDGGVGDCSLLPPGKVCEEGLHWGLLTLTGTKKLSYYSFKLMVEKLEGSNWNNVQEVYNSGNIYAYKFTNKQTNKPTYVAWWDYWNEPNATTKQVSIPISITGKVKITESVPAYENGLLLQQSGVTYPNFFNKGSTAISNGQITINLGQSPVYIESTTDTLGNYIPYVWQESGTTTNTEKQNTNTNIRTTQTTDTTVRPSGNNTNSYCPNGVCDAHEQAQNLCPQDCGN